MREVYGKKHLEAVCDTRLTGRAWRSMRVGIPDGQGNLRHNIEACAPSRTTSPLLLLIVSPTKKKTSSPPAHASGAPNVVGRPGKMTTGFVSPGTSGTRSIPGPSAHHACTNGLQHSAPSVAGGRRIRSGMRLREKQETDK
jgi:hypothetical protein